MIRHFWALPAFLRLGLAGQHTFSIHDDLLAFPQYEVIFSESFVSEEHASLRLAHAAAKSQTAYQGHIPDSSSGSELSQHYQADPGIPGFEDDEQSPLDELQETYERVVLEGMPYLCTIPIVAPPAPENHTMSREEEENELMRATDRGLEALKGMQGNCVYFMSGWWSYQYCYDEGVKQFHQLPP
ncbi:Protein kinase protein rad53, partial [Cryomyces antarcticus]